MRQDPSRNIPKKSSESQEWIQWHKDLKKYYTKSLANSIWVYAWGKRGGVGARGNNANLRNYMEDQGVNIDKTSLQSLGDSVDDVFDSVGRLFSGFSWVFLGLSALAILIILRIIWKLGDNPSADLKDALKAIAVTKSVG